MRIRSYQQLESSDCGITCVRILARYYGKKIKPDFLRSLCDTSRQGISIKDVAEVLTRLGFDNACVKTSVEALEKMPLPAILYWNNAHFVVLYKIRKNRYYIVDPAQGKISLDEADIKRYWCVAGSQGYAIVADPLSEFLSRDFEKPTPVKNLIRMIMGTIRENKKRFSKAFAFTICLILLDLLSPLLFRYGIDEGLGNRDMSIVWGVLVSQLLVFLGTSISSSISEYIMSRLGIDLGLAMVNDYLFKLVRLPMAFFMRKIPSDLINKADDQLRIRDCLVMLPARMLTTVASLVIFFSLLFFYSFEISVVYLGLILFGFAWNFAFIRPKREINYAEFAATSENRNQLYELINGISEIKIHNAQSMRLSLWKKLQERINKIVLRQSVLGIVVSGGSVFLSRLRDVLIVALCASSVIKGEMSMGVMMTISYIVGRLSGPVANLQYVLDNLQMTMMSAGRVDEVLNSEEYEVRSGICEYTCETIRFCGVSYRYPGSESPFVLKNIDIVLSKGSVTAIVGITGGGKSTLLKLLLSIYQPTEGSIFVDGVDLCAIDQSAWLSQIGIVMQDGIIFSDTVAGNIALSDDCPDEGRIWNALRIACLDGFVKDLPMGILTRLGNAGVSLSGGRSKDC